MLVDTMRAICPKMRHGQMLLTLALDGGKGVAIILLRCDRVVMSNSVLFEHIVHGPGIPAERAAHLFVVQYHSGPSQGLKNGM